jgi:hypothetical protein
MNLSRGGRGDADDAFDTVSGTLGLTGCPDSILILRREPSCTTLLGRGRDLEEIEKAITFSKQGCTWRIEGDADEVRLSAERQLILAAMREMEEEIPTPTPKQIAAHASMKEGNVRRILPKMTKDGVLRKARYGKYQIAQKPIEEAIDGF